MHMMTIEQIKQLLHSLEQAEPFTNKKEELLRRLQMQDCRRAIRKLREQQASS